MDGSDAFGPSRAIVVKGDLAEGTDGGVEEFLSTQIELRKRPQRMA
jgi:hypothetical protein